MKNIPYKKLHEITKALLEKMGFTANDSEIIATNMIESNLLGHDSHGVIFLATYWERIQKGHINPQAQTTIASEQGNTTLIDGHRVIGHLGAYQAAKMAVEKAQQSGIAAVGLYNVDHTGRAGSYPTMIAQHGMFGMTVCATGGYSCRVAPFGSKESRLHTNPIAMAAPTDFDWPIVLDMATATTSVGKLRVAKNRHIPLPENYIIDADGQPSIDPNDFFTGGSLLPFGGSQGYKGFGLAVMVEILAGILAHAGIGSTHSDKLNNGTFMIAINIKNFVPYSSYLTQVHELVEYLKSAAPAPGFDEVLLPGEHSWKVKQQRLKSGIPLSAETWQSLLDLLKTFNLQNMIDK